MARFIIADLQEFRSELNGHELAVMGGVSVSSSASSSSNGGSSSSSASGSITVVNGQVVKLVTETTGNGTVKYSFP